MVEGSGPLWHTDTKHRRVFADSDRLEGRALEHRATCRLETRARRGDEHLLRVGVRVRVRARARARARVRVRVRGRARVRVKVRVWRCAPRA